MTAWLGRLALLGVLAFWTWQFAHMDHRLLIDGIPEINGSLWHLVNLVFHEAGHLLFRPFGDFMSVLGGSLLQLLVPLAFLLSFLLRQRDPFAAAAGLWWLGQSLMDLAPYIHDAQAQRMLLLGGVSGGDVPGYHDWNNVLGRLGSLEAAPGLAEAFLDFFDEVRRHGLADRILEGDDVEPLVRLARAADLGVAMQLTNIARDVGEDARRVTGEEPVMWGPSIVGFGSYHYRYASGREGDWMRLGMANDKQYISLYCWVGDDDGYVAERYREGLGTHQG